jgi:hypothetical protein
MFRFSTTTWFTVHVKIGTSISVSISIVNFQLNRNSDEIPYWFSRNFDVEIGILISVSMLQSEFRCRLRFWKRNSDFKFGIGFSILTSEFRFRYKISTQMSKFQSICHRNNSKIPISFDYFIPVTNICLWQKFPYVLPGTGPAFISKTESGSAYAKRSGCGFETLLRWMWDREGGVLYVSWLPVNHTRTEQKGYL